MFHKFKDRMPSKPPPFKQRTFASADLACVAAAVAAREAALSAGVKTHGEAVAGAYGERATTLADAYALTGGNSAIRDAVKRAWESFNAAIRTTRKRWQEARDKAWKQFRTAIKSCKISTEVLDTANASSEPKGE